MQVIKLYLILQSVLFQLQAPSHSQPDSFDVYTYQSPEFFTKSELPAGLQLTMKNSDSSFCMITLYKSRPAKKDMKKNLASQWNEDVVKRLAMASEKPLKIMTGKQFDGWTHTLAIGNFYEGNKKCVVMLNFFQKDKTSACVVFAYSDPLFNGVIERFSQQLHLKTK